MKLILAIAAGGALGAVSRHFVAQQAALWFGSAFPWGILTVNVAGSFILGIVVELSALAWSPSPAIRAMIVVGFCGAFTTFSSFSLDVAVLYERGDFLKAALYIATSVICSIGALFAGMALVRSIYP
ncbi:MAG TPA: fluoride efflux transporter CrcB [Rhodospirillaceae bacterium]|nr:fluoride efflux transporter CrcB [Rhodospirillaceae bacterium]HAT35637.1 fluoride efflux transporter CrcB [Rhodospirillaceae bacterium]